MASSVGSNIRRLRKKRGLTQTTLGIAVGYAPSTLCEIEQGKIRLPAEKLLVFAQELDTTVNELLRGVKAAA